MPEKLILATQNHHKVIELKSMLNGIPFEVGSLEEYPDYEAPEETGKDFKENALIKAKSAAEYTGHWAFADDSGLVVDALDGRPGIYSSRYAENDAARIQKVLTELNEIPDEKRQARFVCSIAIVSPKGESWVVEGKCEGIISHSPQGHYGFGYDPIFYFPGLKKSFAELLPEEKNRVSHRSDAVRKAIELLKLIGCQN
jgi:XTP/dITP diphosphohydrolase